MYFKEKTAINLLFNNNDGIITIFAQNLNCKQGVFESPLPPLKGGYAKRQKRIFKF